MTIEEKMHSRLMCWPNDKKLAAVQRSCLETLYKFNHTGPHQLKLRQRLLKKMFAELGENCYIEPPLHSSFGGRHVHFGNNIYANFCLTLIDDTHIFVDDNTMFGPNVVLATAAHPIAPELRQQGMQCNHQIVIEKNCWLGAGVIVLPGVTIGENSVIGAGSVVTKDIPPNVVAVGNPCRVIKKMERH